MAKSKTEIHVTTVFDGELDATDVFDTDVNPVIWKLLEALHGRWCLMWREGQAAPAAMYGTSNERLVYDQAYTFWPMMVLFVGVMIFGNLLCWLLIRRREVRVPQLLPVWW